MSGTGRRETITLSLGPTANAVTAHLLNLEGLAVTTTSTDNDGRPSCDPHVTHRRDSTNQVWVPRVLMVDESHRLQRQQQNNYVSTATAQTEETSLPQSAAASTWTGSVQEVNMATFSLDDFCTMPSDVVPNFSSMNSNAANQHQQQEQPKWLSSWQQTANELAYAPYSQYRVSQQQQEQQQYSSSQPTQQSESTSRHFNWDDLGDEEPDDEDEEETAALRERQRRDQQRQWDNERQHYEEQLSTVWNSTADSNHQQPTTTGESSSIHHVPTEADLSNLSWMDYWMPPHPSPLSQCTFGLPSTSAVSSSEAPPIHAFNIASSGTTSKLILEDYWEKIRLELESMDACQGFTILTGGTGIYAGMTDWVLQEMQQECRAACRWVFHVADEDDNDLLPIGNQENAMPRPSSSTELARAQARLRNSVQGGLALAGLSDHAHVTVPLMLPSSHQRTETNSLFRASSELAMALETVTLPYRSQSLSKNTLVGWNSMSGYEEGASPNGMSMGDYITTLQPSPRYSLLELDSVLTSDNRQRLGTSLVAGTSIERDRRMRQTRNSSAVAVDYPGSWLLDENYGASPNNPSLGILTSLSPGHVATQDRSLHYHYGLSSCLRRSQSSGSPLLNNDNQQYLTCLMEGMGIRYRPETAFGLTTSQSLSHLTSSSRRQGAGSYWQYLMGAANVDIPVLSVLGNTTRMYPYLQSVASDMKTALTSSKTKGYYQREVASGTLPEIDDCDESLEQCMDLRDVYEPPNGSFLDNEAENYLDI